MEGMSSIAHTPPSPTQRRQPSGWVAQARLSTPLGPLLAACTAHGLGGLWFEGQSHHPGLIDAPTQANHPWLQAAAQALAHYWSHQTPTLPPLDLQGTDFQRAVWAALLQIPSGHTTSYGALAAMLERPSAVRAVGAAVGRNPVSVLVPCHRVLGASGQLTGYAGGLHRKRALLRWETDRMLPSDGDGCAA